MTQPRCEVIGDCTLWLGDALQIIPTLGKIDAVITDPPYSSGAHESAKRNKQLALTPQSITPRAVIQGDVMGTFGFLWFLRVWFRQFLDVLCEGGHLACFIDWRMYPIVSAMADAAGMRATNMLVWDKGYAGLGTGFRAQHELILMASKGAPHWHSYMYGNVLPSMRITSGEHPHEKPLEIMEPLVETCVPHGGLALDTFMGSGTTGIACIKRGRRFIGIEIHEPYFNVACRRIEAAYKQPDLFLPQPSPAPRQEPLFAKEPTS